MNIILAEKKVKGKLLRAYLVLLCYFSITTAISLKKTLIRFQKWAPND